MTDTIKLLAQATPSATTLTDFYTVPGATQAVVSSISICNQNGTDVTFRISLAIAGAGDTTKQYLYYDMPLTANDTFIATIGITLATTDVIRIYASATGLSFNLFGTEIT